jgi:flagellar motor switch protein FliG
MMSDNNFFINKYKKNSNEKKDSGLSDDKKIKFEKIEEKGSKTPKKKLAAMFLILVGTEKAKEILKTFSEEELIKITNEIIGIENITTDEIREVETSFGKVNYDGHTLKGGKEFARTILQNAFGIEKGSGYFIKSVEEFQENELAFLDPLSNEEIKDILADESPLVVSVILSKLDAKRSAKILGCFPKEKTVEIIKTMSGKLEITKDVYEIVLKKMKQKAVDSKDDDMIKISGKAKLVEILKYSDNEQSEKIIQDIEMDDPELADEIKDNIFTFNDIIMLKRKDLEKALKNYADKELAYILKGTKDEIKTIFFTCVSKRRRELIEDEMSVLGAVKKKDVDDRRRDFINYLKDLEQKGKISLKPDKDIYVE